MIPFYQEKSILNFEFAISSPDEPYTITFNAQMYNETDKSITIEELQAESSTQYGRTLYQMSIKNNVIFVFVNIKLTNKLNMDTFYVIKAIVVKSQKSINEYAIAKNMTTTYNKESKIIESHWGLIINNKTSVIYYFILNDKKRNSYSICGQKENQYVAVSEKGEFKWNNENNIFFEFSVTVIGLTEDTNGEYLFAYNVEYVEDKMNILLIVIIGVFILFIGTIGLLTLILYRQVSVKIKEEEEKECIEVEER